MHHIVRARLFQQVKQQRARVSLSLPLSATSEATKHNGTRAQSEERLPDTANR